MIFGSIRQYIFEGSGLEGYSKEKIAMIASRLNYRSRRRLGF